MSGKWVVVTGGAGFLGSFVVEKLREHSAAETIVLRSSQYDLPDLHAIRQLLHYMSLLAVGRPFGYAQDAPVEP